MSQLNTACASFYEDFSGQRIVMKISNEICVPDFENPGKAGRRKQVRGRSAQEVDPCLRIGAHSSASVDEAT